MNLATDYHLFDVPQPVSPSENQVFQQFFSLTVPNARRFQLMDTFKDFLKQGMTVINFRKLIFHLSIQVDLVLSPNEQFLLLLQLHCTGVYTQVQCELL